MPKYVRLTLFKLPEDQLEEAIAKYATLSKDAVKPDSTPYILSSSATRTHDEPRRQGITLVAKTVFSSKEDMEFYDNECKAHGEIKKVLKPLLSEPPVTVVMDAPEEKEG